MKTFRVFTFQLLACCYFLTAAAHASDELIVYVFENGSPLSGVDVQLDDQIIGSTRADGSVRGDLDGGGHVVTVGADDRFVVRFASNPGQLADVVIDLGSSDARVDLLVRRSRLLNVATLGKAPWLCVFNGTAFRLKVSSLISQTVVESRQPMLMGWLRRISPGTVHSLSRWSSKN